MSTTYEERAEIAIDRNRNRKANRAVAAIDHLIQLGLDQESRVYGLFAGTPVADLESGRAFMLDALTNDENGGWWAAVGMAHDNQQGYTTYNPGRRVTQFASSRPAILRKLAVLVTLGDCTAAAQPVADEPEPADGDIFGGLF